MLTFPSSIHIYIQLNSTLSYKGGGGGGGEGGLVLLQSNNIGNIFSDKSLKLQRASPPGLVLSCELCEKFPDNRQERGGRSRI